jgi:hypothetical protein
MSDIYTNIGGGLFFTPSDGQWSTPSTRTVNGMVTVTNSLLSFFIDVIFPDVKSFFGDGLIIFPARGGIKRDPTLRLV